MFPDAWPRHPNGESRLVSMRDRPRLVASALSVAASFITGRGRPARAQEQTPDVVVVLTDDMRDADWQALPRTEATLRSLGTTFPNFFCATPLCSPSRVSLLTGRYSHNHGVLGNGGASGGWARFAELELGSETIQMPLHAAGYRTAHIGKFINGAPARGQVPPGWDTWYCQTDFRYHGPRVNNNGRRRDLGEKAYSTDVLRDKAVAFIRSTPADQPLFLNFSPIAPHNNPTPAGRHDNAFKKTALGDDPAIGEADVTDKPAYIRERGPLNGKKRKALAQLNRDRLRTLLAVDGAIAAIWSALESSGRSDNAYLFVLSDNGFLLGHHRHVGKTTPYDHATCVTMLACGPRFSPGSTDTRLASIVDLAPTIADAAGLDLADMDGVSLLQPDSRDETLLEWLGHNETKRGGLVSSHSPDFTALRTRTHLYVEYESGERELYDYQSDPDELDNLLADWEGRAPTPDAEALAATLAARLDELRDCAGEACR